MSDETMLDNAIAALVLGCIRLEEHPIWTCDAVRLGDAELESAHILLHDIRAAAESADAAIEGVIRARQPTLLAPGGGLVAGRQEAKP